MPLFRHAATPLAFSIQQHPPCPPPPYFAYLCYPQSSPPCPYLQRRRWRQREPQVAQKRRFHTTSRLLDEQIDNAQNHYETLKLEPSATPADIKKSFYALSKRHHPDHNAADRAAASRRFMRISEAYAVLSTPARRHAYDRDALQLHRRSGSHHHPATTHHQHNRQHHGPAGGRPATGLSSRRRGAFQGPPPSFFRSGGWGAHAAKRRAAHEESTGSASASGHQAHAHAHAHGGAGPGPGPMGSGGGGGGAGGMGPGQDPFKSSREAPPHFDRAGHERTGRHGDARRAARQQQEQEQEPEQEQGQGQWRNIRDSSSSSGGGGSRGRKKENVDAAEPERGMAGMFFVIGGVLLLSFLGPFTVSRLFFGGGGGGGGSGSGSGREKKMTTAAKRKAAAAASGGIG